MDIKTYKLGKDVILVDIINIIIDALIRFYSDRNNRDVIVDCFIDYLFDDMKRCRPDLGFIIDYYDNIDFISHQIDNSRRLCPLDSEIIICYKFYEDNLIWGSNEYYNSFTNEYDNIDLDDFIERNKDELTSVVILDGVEDSHNLGAIIRSCVCAGVKGIILPSRRGVLINSTVEKTSAGAVNHISIIKVNSIVNAVQRLKEKNYWVIAADHHAQDNYFDIDYTDMNFALIMGAEHAGISKSLLKLSDFKVKIPMLTNFNSLNVSNATAIILFESVKQRIRGK